MWQHQRVGIAQVFTDRPVHLVQLTLGGDARGQDQRQDYPARPGVAEQAREPGRRGEQADDQRMRPRADAPQTTCG